MNDAVKGYLALASGLTEVTRQRAAAAAKALVSQGGAAAGQATAQASALADDLVAQSKSNREAVTALVRFEIDKALGRVGLASAEEVTELTARVRSLEAELRRVGGPATGGDAIVKTGATVMQPAGTPPAKRSPAKKSPTKQSPAKKAAAKKPSA